MDVNAPANVENGYNSYADLLFQERLSGALGVSIIAVGLIAGNILQNSPYISTIAMCGGFFIGKSIGIHTAANKVTSSIEDRNERYFIPFEEAKSLSDKTFWQKTSSIALFTAGALLTLSETLDSNSKTICMGGALMSYLYGQSKGINDSLRKMKVPEF